MLRDFDCDYAKLELRRWAKRLAMAFESYRHGEPFLDSSIGAWA